MEDLTEFFKNGEDGIDEKPIITRPDLLLSTNLPKPLHGLNPRTIKGTPWWNKTRKEVYASNDFHCLSCGISKYDEGILFNSWLEAHECYDIDYGKRRAVFREIVPLCPCCHRGIHTGRLSALYGKYHTEEDCWLVLERKKQVCGSFGEIDKKSYEDEWSEWRLEFEGKEYKPVHKSYEDWVNYYQNEE